MSLHSQNIAPMAFPSRQEERSVATHFSSLYASLSVCMCVKCVVSVGFFFVAKSQSSSKATDKATAGGWVAGWRREGRGPGGGYRGLNASPHHAPRL